LRRIEIEWRGDGTDEEGFDAQTGRVLVRFDPSYFRPTKADFLLGDSAKARRKLGWAPQLPFGQLVRLMVEHDLNLARREAMPSGAGFAVA
jgi:GDPmannose 4,6-dehydratase